MTSKNPDDLIQFPSKDSEELHISGEDIAKEEISSIIDAVPKLSLESTIGILQSLYHQLINSSTNLIFSMKGKKIVSSHAGVRKFKSLSS